MSTITTTLRDALNQARFGDHLHVKRVNVDRSLSSRVSGPVLAAHDLSPAVAIDTLDGGPHMIRDANGQVWGAIAYLSVRRGGRIVAVFSESDQPEGAEQ